MILYRYRAMNERTLQTLIKKELYFSKSSHLNDVDEFKSIIDVNKLQSIIKNHLNGLNKKQRDSLVGKMKCTYLTSVVYEIIYEVRKLYEGVDETDAFIEQTFLFGMHICDNLSYANTSNTYRKNVNRIIDRLVNKNAYDDELRSNLLDDLVLDRFWSHRYERDYKFLTHITNYFFKEGIANVYHVNCLTTDNKSRVMWGNYADSYNGFVVGYKLDNLNKCGVEKYDFHKFQDFYNKPKSVLCKVNYGSLEGLDYTEQIIEYFYDITRNEKSMEYKSNNYGIHALFYKDAEWNYEKEYRIIKNSGQPMKIQPDFIFLGERLSMINRRRLKSFARENKIDCYVMVQNDNLKKGILEFEKL